MNCIMSNQWERRMTEQINKQQEQISQLSVKIDLILSTLRNHGINPPQ